MKNRLLALAIALGGCAWLGAMHAFSMEIVWTHMVGQWPGEGAPIVADLSGHGRPQILMVNRGGQVLSWTTDGVPLGRGQDGMILQLPAGRWTTAPVLLETNDGTRLVVGSVEGLIVGLDQDLQVRWQHRLPGETGWGKAAAAILPTDSGLAFCFGDRSGTATCLSAAGQLLWTNALGTGPITEAPQAALLPGKQPVLFVAAGSVLFCLDRQGRVRWRQDLGQDIQTRPEIFAQPEHLLVACGIGSGKIVALDSDGVIRWECLLDDAPLSTLTTWRRSKSGPWLLCTGLWGNLHAVDAQGHRVWTHLFRAKVRAVPVIYPDADEERSRIYLPTFHQHLYAFDARGNLTDDLRLSGILPSSVVPLRDPITGPGDLLVVSSSLLAHRVRPGPPQSPYGPPGDPRGVTLSVSASPGTTEAKATVLRVNNPEGALLRVNVAATTGRDTAVIRGRVSSRSLFELPWLALSKDSESARVTIRDAHDGILIETNVLQPPKHEARLSRPATNGFMAWPTPAYELFRSTSLTPGDDGLNRTAPEGVAIESLYQGEADQGAFVVASMFSEIIRVRAVIGVPTNAHGHSFAGTLVLREVVFTGSVNGESVPDALPALGDDGLFTLPAHRAVKIWVSANARGAKPGRYQGKIGVIPLLAGATLLELPLVIDVLPLAMPAEFPLTQCTWDYVPNQWFSSAETALADMNRHGVNVFPRGASVPPATIDSAGRLAIDWAPLDADLARLKARGIILFQMTQPPIRFPATIAAAEKRPLEIEYLHAFRDHLQAAGRVYSDYAFYPLDEPGLDYGKSVPVLIESAKLFREADRQFQVYTDPVPGLSWQDFERIEPWVDVWAPNMRLVSGLLSGDPRMARILKGKTVWSYECVAQVKSLSPLRYNRANAWRAKFFGLQGIGFWTHSTTQADIWHAGKSIEDEYALVYPGTTPVPSARWEAARDGLEDVAAMVLLEKQIEARRRRGTRATAASLVGEAERALRLALRDVMELSDDTFVESRDYLRQGDRQLWHTSADVELFRRHRHAIAQLTQALSEQEQRLP